MKGLAYCEQHYYQMFGRQCYVCNQVIQGGMIRALDKVWCVNHFACAFCNNQLTEKSKFYDVDTKPCCKKCYEKFPRDVKKRLAEQHRRDKKAQKQQLQQQQNLNNNNSDPNLNTINGTTNNETMVR